MGYDEPEILPYPSSQNCLIGAENRDTYPTSSIVGREMYNGSHDKELDGSLHQICLHPLAEMFGIGVIDLIVV